MNEFVKRLLRQNWAYYSHEQLYKMVRTEAAGAKVMSDADRAWAEFAELMAGSRRKIDGLLKSAGVTWEGMAADSMRAGVIPVAQWAEDAGTAGQASGSGLRQIGDAFAFTSTNMPEPARVEVNARFADVFAGQVDRDRQERAAQEGKQRAVELMQRYSANAHSAVSSLGVFLPPQEVTVRPGAAAPGGGIRQANGAIVTAPRDESTPGREQGPSERAEEPGERGTARGGLDSGNGDPAAENGGPAGPVRSGGVTATAAVPANGQAAVGGQLGGQPIPADPLAAGGAGEAGSRPVDRLPGRPAPGPGAGPGGGGRQDGGAVRAHGAKIAARAGAIGTGPAITPAAAARREEDGEHVSPEYLHSYHDEFWDVTPHASPPVIGGEEPPRAVPER